jgi:hypothetical protein
MTSVDACHGVGSGVSQRGEAEQRDGERGDQASQEILLSDVTVVPESGGARTPAAPQLVGGRRVGLSA